MCSALAGDPMGRPYNVFCNGARLIGPLHCFRSFVALGFNQPLTAPAARPLTRCFWKSRMTTMMGIVAETDAAAAKVK